MPKTGLYKASLNEIRENFNVYIFASYLKDEIFPCIKLKVQSCKLCNCKYMINSTQIKLSRKVLFINRKDNRNCKKVAYFFKK